MVYTCMYVCMYQTPEVMYTIYCHKQTPLKYFTKQHNSQERLYKENQLPSHSGQCCFKLHSVISYEFQRWTRRHVTYNAHFVILSNLYFFARNICRPVAFTSQASMQSLYKAIVSTADLATVERRECFEVKRTVAMSCLSI